MNRQILLVEDSSAVGLLARKVIEAQGADCAVRTTGGDAKFYLGGCTPDQVPDLILIDLYLPDVSGLDLLQWFKADQRLKRVPVCVMARSADDGAKRDVYEAGGASFIQVPISLTAFERLLAEVLVYWLAVVQLPPR